MPVNGLTYYIVGEESPIRKETNLRKVLLESGPAAFWVNVITIYRIVMSPVLVALIVTGSWSVFRWLLLVSFITDMIDGTLARSFRVNSILGARLDSLGDDLTVLVAVAALFVHYPDFIQAQLALILIVLGVFAIQFIAGVLKFRKITSFHTYGAKVAALFQGVFLLSVFFFDEITMWLFYSAMIITLVELVEEIVLVFMLREWQTDVRSIVHVLRRRSSVGG